MEEPINVNLCTLSVVYSWHINNNVIAALGKLSIKHPGWPHGVFHALEIENGLSLIILNGHQSSEFTKQCWRLLISLVYLLLHVGLGIRGSIIVSLSVKIIYWWSVVSKWCSSLGFLKKKKDASLIVKINFN